MRNFNDINGVVVVFCVLYTRYGCVICVIRVVYNTKLKVPELITFSKIITSQANKFNVDMYIRTDSICVLIREKLVIL